MAAPSGIVWGSIAGGYGRIGIYTNVSSTNTTTTVKVEVWFWSKYSVSDSSNTYYYDNLSSSGSATTSRGSVSINTTVASGSGWSTSNQQRLGSSTYTYNRGTSASTRYLYAKLINIDRVGSTMTASTTVSIPKLASYTISYNANGGSGAPSSQTKWYGKTLTLSSTKPTRTGYSFQGWGTSTTDTSVDYDPGDSYTANASDTLYAIWKANTYAVKYNANGGSGAPSAQTKTHGVTLKLSSTKPTRTNYNFKGWGTSASTTTVSYAAGANYTSNAAITLYAIWELAYTKPRITGFSLTRCDSNGVSSDEGTNALVKFNWACDTNVSSITIKWKTSAETVWSQASITVSGTSGSVNQIVGSDLLSTDNTYDFSVTVTDTQDSSYKNSVLEGTVFVIDALNGGNGVAFGKPAELKDTADFNFDILSRKDLIFDEHDKVIYGTKPDGTVTESFNPQNASGNTVLGYGNYDKRSGNTNVYGNDVNIGIANIASPTTFRPYRRRGDTITLILRTTGYVTNAGKDVVFQIPFSVPIIGSPTMSVASVNGFILRQGGNYTHGSTASTYVKPSSYDIGYYAYHGLRITASFSNTTNVTNNDAIGIYWNGTITFS